MVYTVDLSSQSSLFNGLHSRSQLTEFILVTSRGSGETAQHHARQIVANGLGTNVRVETIFMRMQCATRKCAWTPVFVTYISPVVCIANKFGVFLSQYADNTQLYYCLIEKRRQ